MDVNMDGLPPLGDVSDLDSESDDGFFAGEDEQDDGWESDEGPDESEDWEEGEEPWQQGLSQRDSLGDIFEAEAARAGAWPEFFAAKFNVFMPFAAHNLSEEDLNDIRASNYKADTQITDTAYEKLSLSFPQLADLSSLYVLQKRMVFLSGVEAVKYDCCINSCIAYTCSDATLQRCPFCHEARLDSEKKRIIISPSSLDSSRSTPTRTSPRCCRPIVPNLNWNQIRSRMYSTAPTIKNYSGSL
jgi:hypothetical protein